MKRKHDRGKLTHGLAAAALLAAAAAFGVPAGAQEQSAQKVDVLFFFDDTVSFESYFPGASSVMQQLIADLEQARPQVEFAFGVARFEDYGGPGWDYCAGVRPCAEDQAVRIVGRPFILNQPLLTSAAAGGQTQRNALLLDALEREAPGFGGDDPEPTLGDALFQLATGVGFDGNGDGSLTGSAGDQVAGAANTQTAPDQSGDVPPFSSLGPTVPRSGTIGGAGFRPDALKLVILATEICSGAAFPAGSAIPSTIRGRYSEEKISDFSCLSPTPGTHRFGYVGNAKSAAANTVAAAVAPSGGATLAQSIEALNAADIRVIGIGPDVGPQPSGSGPSFQASVYLSALARITGAVDSQGAPLVFDVSDADLLEQKISESIVTTTDKPENPGCEDRDLADELAALSKQITAQNELAVRSARLLRKARVSKAKIDGRLTALQKNFDTANGVLTAYPRLTTVCASLACESVDHRSDLALVQTAMTAFHKEVRAAVRQVRKAGRLPKRAAKWPKTSKTMLRQCVDAFEQIPETTNICNR